MNKRKTVILFFVAICFVSGIVSLVLYKFSDEDSGSYSIQDNAALALVSATPMERNGVSQDSTIVLQWNQPVLKEVGNAVVISPSVRGAWSTLGNSLVFTPQQFAAGTYYTVSIPSGTVMNSSGDILKEDIFFSFETENSAQRIPSRSSFSVNGRQFNFAKGSNVTIPVSCIGENVTEVTTAIYRSSDIASFTEAFSELFAFPAWAQQSIADFKVNAGNFEKQSEADMAVVTKDGSSCVDLGSLPKGQYLVRLTAAGISYDVAVNVSTIDASVVQDNGSLQLWTHQNGQRFDGAEITVKGKEYTADENGFVVVDYPYDRQRINDDPGFLGITIKGNDDAFVYFLSAEETDEKYSANLVLNTTSLSLGDSLMASGYVGTEMGKPLNDRVSLELRSSVATLDIVEVEADNGYFTHTWDKEVFADGEYQVCLCYNGKELDTKKISLDHQTESIYLLAQSDASTVESGEKVVYEVKVVNQNGKAVNDAMVTMNDTTVDKVNSDGLIKFSTRYHLAAGVTSLTKNAIFHVDTPYGTAEDVIVAVNVVAHKDSNIDEEAPVKTDVADLSGDTLALGYDDGTFYTGADTTGNPSYYWQYAQGCYTKNELEQNISVSAPSDIAVTAGETIRAEIYTGGSSRRLTVVSLYKGLLPEANRNKTFTGEAFDGSTLGQLEESRVFFGAEAINAAFSAANRNGDYFLRVAVESFNGSVISRYIPVTVQGVTLLGDEERNYPNDYEVSLPFWTDAEEKMNYTLTLGDQVFTGSGNGFFTVDTGITAVGYYSGELTLSTAEGVAAVRSVSFNVYDNDTIFYNVENDAQNDAAYLYEMKKDKAAEFSALLEIVTQPGNQLLQHMAKTLYARFLPSVAKIAASDSAENIISFQGKDGGFSRYDGGESDLLLSVLIAEEKCFDYDKDALCGYFKYRLNTATDPEVAALACWGLCYFNIDCSDCMDDIAGTRGLSDRALLYLAQGYEVDNQTEKTDSIYRKMANRLSGDKDMLWLDDTDAQYSITNTGLMLDLAIKLQREEKDGLMAFLLNQDIQTQTGRYLLALSVLNSVKEKDIAEANGMTAKEGNVILSLCPQTDEDFPILNNAYFVDENEVKEVAVGEAVTMNIQWENEDNCIYLVCAEGGGKAYIAEKDGFYGRNGHYEAVLFANAADLTFMPRTEGEGIAPVVYILNLTTDEIVGKTVGGIKVVKK